MSPLLRLWGISALCIALLLLSRGAIMLALACFLFSPAPVLLFARGSPGNGTLSLSWLRALLIVVVASFVLFALVVYFGGIPQVHEWPVTIRNLGK